MDGLLLYNGRTRCKEAFQPLESGHARIYSCGTTVYSPQHLGNLRPYLFADLLKRALLAEGLRVTHVVNITDVGHLTDDADAGDDKMELAVKRTGRRAEEIAGEYTEKWQRDCRRVNCLEADVLCKATDHIPEQIAMVQLLEKKDYTYRIPDGIYFDISKFPRYADFARLDLEMQVGGKRIGEVAGKRHPADFALWKFAEKGVARQQEWDSPWGRGFPGWHVECSAMSSKYLGQQFDIHTGGIDHLTVHHTNEIAQSECAFGVHPWVQVWMHNEWLDFRGQKMSKSLGNVYLLDDLVADGHPALAFRYFFLQAHYRKQQTFNDDAMESAARGYRRLLASAIEVREAEGEADPRLVEPHRARFRDAVRDDLNGPQALAVASEVARDRGLSAVDRHTLLLEFDEWLGLDLATATLPEDAQESDPHVDALVAKREDARANRDWAEADRIRDALVAEGVVIEDTPEGPRWRRK